MPRCGARQETHRNRIDGVDHRPQAAANHALADICASLIPDTLLDEQVFRYNNRATKDNPLTDADRFMLAASQIAGKRLTYAELTGKVGETGAEPF